MKKKIYVLGVAAALLASAYLFFVNGGAMILAFAYWHVKMWQGKKYLHSIALNEDAKHQLVKEANYLLGIDSLKTKCIGAVRKNSPLFLSRYKRLGIQRIDVCKDGVSFMWMGGLDHTGLYIKRKDSSYVVIAGYNDYEGQEIFPVVKEPWNSLKKSKD